MKLKQYLIASMAIISAYGMMTLPGQLVKAVGTVDISDEVSIRDLRTPASIELEPSEELKSLDNVDEVSVQWDRLKSLVEAPEGSEEVLDVVYFDVPMSEELQDHIFEQCEAVGLEPEIVVAVIARESMYDSDAIGDGGRAFGLMQIHPRWHSERMKELGCTDLLNPFENVTVGIDILGELYEVSGSVEWALMAYNGGDSYADSLVAEGRVSDYVKDVLGGAEELVD